MTSDIAQIFQTDAAFLKTSADMTDAQSALLKSALSALEEARLTVAEQANRIAELEALTTIDSVTGLLNRRGFFQAFEREIGRVNREVDEGGLLALIDVDNFGTVNRLYGHGAGDTCLKLVRHALINDIRQMDVVARIGADEFVLVLPTASAEKAASRLQQLALRLNNLSFIWSGAEICVSASLAIKNYGRGDTAEEIFKAADRALNREKEKKKKYAF